MLPQRGGCVTMLGCGADEELIAWVPGRLLLEAARDVASMHALLDGPLRQGLFPLKLSADALARQWGAVWLAAPAAERRALQRLLIARSRMQAAVGKLLAAREEARSGAGSEQTQAKLQVRAPRPDCRFVELLVCVRLLGFVRIARSLQS